MSEPWTYDRGHDDNRDPELLCPLCEHSEGETLCPTCAGAGWAKCGCCDEYDFRPTPQPWACGCADDTPLCEECRESTKHDECSKCFSERPVLAGIDYPTHMGKGGGLS
jgi:hypothetical protein